MMDIMLARGIPKYAVSFLLSNLVEAKITAFDGFWQYQFLDGLQPGLGVGAAVIVEGPIADANAGELGHAGHSREASTAFSEACTAYLRILSRIGAIAFEHFRRAALRSIRSH
jgi:hypothetical protein